MSTEQLSPRALTEREQETFRRDFQDKEREIQRYIGVYLSGLVIVTGWIIGPQSRPVLAMALGNEGYNVYAFLIFLVLNIAFTSFLIYKSLIIHEITQFMTYLAKPDSPFVYWESWRRSRQSATKRVRGIYTASLSLLPVCVSVLLMYGIGNLLYSDPGDLLNRLAQMEQAASAQVARQGVTTRELNLEEKAGSGSNTLTREQLAAVLNRARVWFVIVIFLHAIPLYFFFENVVPTSKRWKKIHLGKNSGSMFDKLEPDLPSLTSRRSIWLYEKGTNRELGPITQEQLQILRDTLVEENSDDRDYYLNKQTLDLLRKAGLDKKVTTRLKNAMGERQSLDIEWSDEQRTD